MVIRTTTWPKLWLAVLRWIFFLEACGSALELFLSTQNLAKSIQPIFSCSLPMLITHAISRPAIACFCSKIFFNKMCFRKQRRQQSHAERIEYPNILHLSVFLRGSFKRICRI
jgi:hypothetical protein